MSGETDLQRLLAELRPAQQPGAYVFCAWPTATPVPAQLHPVGIFHEREAVTRLRAQAEAEALALPHSGPHAWITLTVHSALEAVGLTAAVAQALTQAGVSCNVVAAFYHDHLFVPQAAAARALEALAQLSSP